MAASTSYGQTDRVFLAAEYASGWGAGTSALAASVLAPVLLTATGCALFASCLSLPALVAYGIVGCAVAVAGGIASARYRHGRRLSLVAGAAMLAAMATMLVVPSARADLYAVFNATIWHVDEVYGALFELIAPGDIVAGTPLFGALMGIVTGVLWWRLTRLRTTAPTLLAVIVCCGVYLHLGLANAVSVILGVAGWLAHCRLTQLKCARTSWATLLVNLAIAFCICGALFGVCAVLYSPQGAFTTVRESILTAFDRFRFGERVLPEGDLTLAADLNGKTDDHLDITVEGTPADDLLLRGYVGATFKGGSWQAIDHTAFSGTWNGVISWLGDRGFTPVRQRSLYDALKHKEQGDDLGEYTLDIHAGDTDRRYAFTPYSANADEELSTAFDHDGSLKCVFWGNRSYSFDVDNVPSTEVFDDTSWLASSTGDYVESERVYSAFAKSAYTKIGKRERAAIERYIFNDDTWDASAATSTYAVISRVRAMLGTLATYTDTPAVPAGDKAFTEWFLGEAREGNAAYFATVATLALRSQGIPARYVEGYRATADELAAAVKVGGDLRLDSSDLHAWCEVYIDGQGWTPVEVTPGFYSQAVEADSVIDVSEAWSGGSQSDALQAGSVMGDIDKHRRDTHDDASSILGNVLKAVVVLLALVVIALLIVIGQRHVRIRVCRERMESNDQSICVPELYRVLSLIMKENLSGFDATRPLDGLEGFEDVFRGIDVREYRRVLELHQAYAFGGRELRVGELRAVRRLTERMHAAMPEPEGFKARITRYAVDAL